MENVIPFFRLGVVCSVPFVLIDKLRQLKGKGRRELILAHLWASPPVIHVIKTFLTWHLFIYFLMVLGLFLPKYKSGEANFFAVVFGWVSLLVFFLL